MPNAPRFQSDACLLRRGMTTIFTHLGKFQPAKVGKFQSAETGEFSTGTDRDGLTGAGLPASYEWMVEDNRPISQ